MPKKAIYSESVSTELAQAVAQHRAAKDNLVNAVLNARQGGMTWQKIGDALGVTQQAARQRYGRVNFD